KSSSRTVVSIRSRSTIQAKDSKSPSTAPARAKSFGRGKDGLVGVVALETIVTLLTDITDLIFFLKVEAIVLATALASAGSLALALKAKTCELDWVLMETMLFKSPADKS